jgi:hypothetical protein
MSWVICARVLCGPPEYSEYMRAPVVEHLATGDMIVPIAGRQ